METVSLGGQPYAALMTGAAAELLAYVLDAPVWGSVLIGSGTALATKVSLDRTA